MDSGHSHSTSASFMQGRNYPSTSFFPTHQVSNPENQSTGTFIHREAPDRIYCDPVYKELGVSDQSSQAIATLPPSNQFTNAITNSNFGTPSRHIPDFPLSIPPVQSSIPDSATAVSEQFVTCSPAIPQSDYPSHVTSPHDRGFPTANQQSFSHQDNTTPSFPNLTSVPHTPPAPSAVSVAPALNPHVTVSQNVRPAPPHQFGPTQASQLPLTQQSSQYPNALRTQVDTGANPCGVQQHLTNYPASSQSCISHQSARNPSLGNSPPCGTPFTQFHSSNNDVSSSHDLPHAAPMNQVIQPQNSTVPSVLSSEHRTPVGPAFNSIVTVTQTGPNHGLTPYPDGRYDPYYFPSAISESDPRTCTSIVNTPFQPNCPYRAPGSSTMQYRGSFVQPAECMAFNNYPDHVAGRYRAPYTLGGPVISPNPPYPYIQPRRFTPSNIQENGPRPSQLSGTDPFHRFPVGYTNHHLPSAYPIQPSPNAPQSSLPQSQVHALPDPGKCNGVNDNPPYPPILPRLPGSPSTKDNSVTSPRKVGCERRRQPRSRKKPDSSDLEVKIDSAHLQAINTDDSTTDYSSPVKRPRGRGRKPQSAKISPTTPNEGPIDHSDSAPPTDESSAHPVTLRSKKRRNSNLSACPKRLREIKPKLTQSSENADEVKEQTEVAVSEPIQTQPDTPVKPIRPRPPRPKKKRPLPTLIRKKRRSAFYGDDSDSEPDISGRLGGRPSEPRISSGKTAYDKKRRSERTAGDRKKYTVDLDLNLSDDDSDATKNGEMATMNSQSGMVEDGHSKVVEYVLGRRLTKRVVKRGVDSANREEVADAEDGEEEEEEEEVEEFYLKYKGYSYLHCEWRALDEIEDPRIRPKMRRFELKQASSIQNEDDDVVLFNPDYVEVERVLDMKVYRDGQLVTSKRADRESVPEEVRKERRRERERNRVRAVRAARAKLKREAEEEAARAGNEDDLDRATPIPDDLVPSTPTSRAASETTAAEGGESLCELSTPLRRESTSETIESLDRTSDHASISNDGNVSDSSTPDQATDDNTAPNDTINPLVPSSPDDSTVIDGTGDERLPDITKNTHTDSDGNTSNHGPVTVTYYLVKWRSLPYEDATWELAQDVDPTKVKEFLKWRNPPKVPPVARDSQYKIIRPDPSTWKPIETERIYKNQNKLRDYQLEGVNWLTYCWYHHRNCILADEMGLGKTVQSVAFLMEIANAGVPGPFLIIVPLSTVANWQRELENWSDLNVVVYHGSSTSRNMIQEYEIFYKRRPSNPAVRHDVYKFQVLVTTFEVLMTDIQFFGRIHWVAGVIDEAHRLKNKKCKLSEGLRYLDLDHRVLLTGTPLQNSVEELFGLLNFLEPERFNCSTSFVAEYGDLKTEEQVENLKNLLKPMMLRRLKEDVEKSLAPKEETIVEVELTNIQKKYYRAIMERNFTFLCKGSTYSNAPNLMNVMMELRKCCNHPFLIKGAEDAILEEMRAQHDPNQTSTEETLTFQALVNASGKLVLVHKLLPKLKADGHKVLIFSQMIRVLDIIEDYLIHQRFQFERIDGRIHGPLRQEAIDRFTADPDKFVFLLCTKAGGLGINLTAADVVIIYDSDWNPQNDLQAQARCHRIGQQKMVKVYRLITRNTYEREMFDRASLKLGLDRAVLQSMGSKEARQAQLSKKEIEELLKKGAYGALMDDDKAGEEFCEEDIDKILQSRSRVVQLEQGEKNSTFSKATFSMSGNRSDIALDDPNFWQKWAKLAGVDETVGTLEDLIMKTPRQRRQTSRYTALPMTEPTTVQSPNYEGSEQEDSATAQSSGDENSQSTSGNRGRRGRKQRRHSRLFDASRLQAPFMGNEDNGHSITGGLRPDLIEPLDRADVFRVERCLLTWPWGQWDRGVASVPFKRQMTAPELAYFATAVLAFSLRFMPPSADTRVRTTVVTLSRPHVWNLNMHEAAKAVSRAISRASRGCPFVDPVEINAVTPKAEPEPVRSRPEGHSDVESACSAPASPLIETTRPDNVPTPKPSDPDDLVEETIPTQADLKSPEELKSPPESSKPSSDKAEEGEAPASPSASKNTVSPKTASFDPDYLVPYDSFRKHMQRHSPRLFNRVALLFFLQCEVVGIEPTVDLMAGRLSHTDFSDLAATLPPLEAIDAEPPVPWWDSCCDKCLLLGILKHGWEKYTSMRLDPSLCFYGRATARLKELEEQSGEETKEEPTVACKQEEEQVTSNQEDKTELDDNLPAESDDIKPSESPSSPKKELDVDDVDKVDEDGGDDGGGASELLDPALVDSLLTALPFPAVADLNSRARKIVAFFSRIKNQLELDANRRLPADEEDESSGTSLPHPRILENRTIKWTRREEADFYRVVSSFGVEFTSVPSNSDATDGTNSSSSPVKRRYRWQNFRRLSNINRKSDVSLTEYFQSFYRMCQRVCKRPLTEFAGPATTAATATTSGSSALGEEVPIEPISEERANRCLSRIDLLSRIRNHILPHPQLEERLRLCQRSSENPSWWIPGKHDGELLRAAAKHGLARTDLNMLSDPEFSFHRYITSLREMGKGESGDRAGSPPRDTARSGLKSESDAFNESEEKRSEPEPNTAAAVEDVQEGDGTRPVMSPSKSSSTEMTSTNQTVSSESPAPSKSSVGPSILEQSAKYGIPLANIWPKDRTIQHRLELVCQTIETNEWPVPRRYPTAASALLISESNRPGNEGGVLNLASSYPGLRHQAFPSSSSFPLNLPASNNLQSPYELLRAINNSKRLFSGNSSQSPDQATQLTLNLLKAGSEQAAMLSDVDALGSTASPSHDEVSSPLTYNSESPSSMMKSSDRTSRGMYQSDSPVSLSPGSPRGRGRGRGRGSRGARIFTSRGRASLTAGRGSSGSTGHSPGAEQYDNLDDLSSPDPSMLPPSTGTMRNFGRGRKRRVETLRHSATDLTGRYPMNTSSKRERLDSTDSKAKSSSNADVWEVRVPVISLVDGSLIYGDQAPKRRVLEQWLESNPNYMPYSVEVEDRIIYNRVASARGQDTNNMEALAYKHYLNSLIMNATVGLQQSSGPSTKTAAQLLQLQQQQQLLQAFGAYARHPAYASLLASALGGSGWPTGSVESSVDSTPSSAGAGVQSQSPSTSYPTTSTTVSSTNPPPVASTSREHTAARTSSSPPADSNTDMESALSTAYKQATANLAYLCNPLAAAYNQLMLSTPSVSSDTSGNLTAQQQAAIASLYTSCMLAAKQAQQQQQQQQQQLAALASALASACSSTNGSVDAASLLSLFTQSRTAAAAATAATTTSTATSEPIASVSTSHSPPPTRSHPEPVESDTTSEHQPAVPPEPETDQSQSVLDLSK